MLCLGPAHTNAGNTNQITNAAADKASLVVKHAISHITHVKDQQDTEDPASVPAETASYILPLALREIFDNADTAVRKGQFRYSKAESLDLPPNQTSVGEAFGGVGEIEAASKESGSKGIQQMGTAVAGLQLCPFTR